MAGSQEDLQILLRVLTKKNGSVLTVMRQAKSLQAANLRSVQQIAEAPLETVTRALGDAKSAKTVHATCKKHMTDSSQPGKTTKRGVDAYGTESDSQSAPKRARLSGDDGMMTAGQSTLTEGAEESLTISAVLDLDVLASTRVYTNRAPLLLAFSFELLRFTMPEQPVSSRLSLSQAVVSSNARFKAASLGLEGHPGVPHSSWTDGQPKITIMGRQIPVLRRDDDTSSKTTSQNPGDNDAVPGLPVERADGMLQPAQSTTGWSTSRPISSRGSTFVARIIALSDNADGPKLVRSLIDANDELKTASHNSWGLRRRSTSVGRQSEDDGETGCGGFILGLLDNAQLDNVLVVISRWFGGILLGPQRWDLMRKCFDEAMSEHLRQTGQTGPDGTVALWALDVDGVDRSHNRPSVGTGNSAWSQPVPGATVFRPQVARDYLARSFLSAPPDTQPREATTRRRRVASQGISPAEHNMACVLGAIRAVFESWEGHLSAKELDAKAWSWYAQVRPQVEEGPGGWGAKGWLELKDVLALRRQQVEVVE